MRDTRIHGRLEDGAARAENGRVAGAAVCMAFHVGPVALAGLALQAAMGSALPLALAMLGLWSVVAAIVLTGLGAHPHPRFGPANTVTALRAAGMVGLAVTALEAASFGAPERWAVFAAALVLLGLDGVDGALARRTGLASAFGARFDVEVDAAFTLALSALVWQAGMAGPAILLLIVPYYAFSVARLAWPWLAGPLPPSLLRKAICVLQMGMPLVLLVVAVPRGVADLACIGVLGTIMWSFARDIRALRAQAS